MNLVISILHLRITRLEQKAATRMGGVLVGYDHRARVGSDGKKKKSEVFFRPLPTIVFAPDALLIIKYIPNIRKRGRLGSGQKLPNCELQELMNS